MYLATPGSGTTGESSAHAYGDLRLAFTDDSSTTLDDRFTFRYNGNFGIGTNSPTYPLDVVANSSAQAIKVRGRSDHIGEINMTNNAGDSTYTQLQSHASEFKIKTIANIPLSFHTNNTERLVISNSGNISTHPPAGNHFVINEDSVDSDFRVESDGNAHMLLSLIHI